VGCVFAKKIQYYVVKEYFSKKNIEVLCILGRNRKHISRTINLLEHKTINLLEHKKIKMFKYKTINAPKWKILTALLMFRSSFKNTILSS